MAEQSSSTAGTEGDGTALAERITSLVERSQKVWAASLDRSMSEPVPMKADPLNTGPALLKMSQDYWTNPQKMVEANMKWWAAQADLWNRFMTGQFSQERPEPAIEPEKGDKRFKHEVWEENPFYDYLKQSYLLTGKWLKERLQETEGLDTQERRKLEVLTRNYVEAMAPSNVPGLNPQVLETTLEEGGDNLFRGLENLIRDLDRGDGVLMIRQTDMEAFEVGENIAVTPGKVIFQNELFQLIQYAPQTDKVHEVPLMFIPPWINKYYILDLNEKKSLIRWLVERGHTVFVISWVNPDERHKDETWESYMEKGVLTALDKVLEETGQPQANVVGYCIGGTMLGTALAWMAAKGDDRVKSATFFTAQLDFSDAGDLQAFVDEGVLETLEGQLGEEGFLAARNMFNAFNSLRSTDLIWGFVINNYLLGNQNFPFDLLYWNSDSTAMPGKLHLFYLDHFYNKNALAKGESEIAGEKLDLSDVKLPCYHLATVEDHIAPSPSAYRGARLLGGRSHKFVLSGSGHIAGVINPPEAEKYQYWTKPGLKEEALEEWREDAKMTEGSWWPDWDKWLSKHSKNKVDAREPGSTLGTIEDAPGSYVRVRADERD